jgi:hypothetical protein
VSGSNNNNADMWLSCSHRYSATENDLVAFFEGFDVVRGSVRSVSSAWRSVRNGRCIFICIAVWVANFMRNATPALTCAPDLEPL